MSGSKSKEKGQIVKGLIIAMASSAILCMVYALLIEKGKCTADNADIVLCAIVLFCAAIGSTAAVIGSTNRLIRGLITGVIFSVILVIIPILAYPDAISWSKIIRIVAVSTCGGLIGGIVNLGKSNKKFHKGRKKRI
jgi:putative membrane protein, TIGR04086 family